MRRSRFRQLAERYWARIPERFRDGAILLVHDEAFPDEHNPGVFLLGACEPAFPNLEEGYAAAADPRAGDRQSLVHVWHGSFRAMAERALEFDWEYELEETLLHELLHHWEGRAGLDGLDRFDEAQIVNFQRVRGFDVPWGFWRDGEPAGSHRWHIDGDLFVEVEGSPPWTVDPEDGGAPVVCEPDPRDGFATVYGRGRKFDGERRDLVVAQRPPERRSLWRRLFGRKAKEER